MTTTNDHVTNARFQAALKDLEHHIDWGLELQASRLSEKLTNRINDTYWKLIPIVIGLMTVVNGVFFLAYKIS
jgi:hypothetical protein